MEEMGRIFLMRRMWEKCVPRFTKAKELAEVSSFILVRSYMPTQTCNTLQTYLCGTLGPTKYHT